MTYLHPSAVSRRARSGAWALALATASAVWSAGCGSDVGPSPSPPPPCLELCQDRIAVRALRETMKLVYNLTLQGKPVGAQDARVDCPLGGRARVFGEAASNPVQGATEVTLTYEFEGCVLLERDEEADENYRLALTGTFVQAGTLAVQPTATTALSIRGDAVTLSGTVHEPAIAYEAPRCAALFAQSGNRLTGTLCGRSVTVDL